MIPLARPLLGREEMEKLEEAIKTGWISSKGRFVGEFENGFAKYCGASFGVATSSGTAALHLALKALGIKPGDEVIIPSLTFIATANTVAYCGARPVFVDSHPDYWCIDPGRIEEKITEKTKVIVPVHLYGHPCEMDQIMEIAERHSLHVIEDCAEAHGAKYKGKRVGDFGTINCFSFFGNKTITSGEGGMCLTNDQELTERMRILRDHGRAGTSEYRHDFLGFNYRMTNLQAAVGLAQLEKIDRIIAGKNSLVEQYNTLLEGAATLPPRMVGWAEPTCWIYSVLINNHERVMEALKREGIETRPFFLPIHKQPIYKTGMSLPVSESLHQRGISLPTFVGLEKGEIESICGIIKNSMG